MYCMTHIHNPVYYRKFRHIQPYLVAYLELCVTLVYLDLPYTNARSIQNSVKTYSGTFRTLCNARILKTLPYLELLSYSEFWD